MDNSNLLKDFSSLIATLEQLGLLWVISEVQETISMGALEEKEMDVMPSISKMKLTYDEKSIKSARRRSKSRLLLKRDFNTNEKLAILINAIDQIAINISDFENSTVRMLSSFQDFNKVTLVRELPEEKEDINILSLVPEKDITILREVIEQFKKELV